MIVVDKNGKEIFSTIKNAGDSAYYYLGYGDGTILAIENVSNFDENSYWLCEIALDGTTTRRLALSSEKDINYDDVKYIGEDLFQSSAKKYIYDRKTHELVSLSWGFSILQPFKNGKTIGGTISLSVVEKAYAVSIDDIRQAEKTGKLDETKLPMIGKFHIYPEQMTEQLINNSQEEWNYGWSEAYNYGATIGIYNYSGELLAAYPQSWDIKEASGFQGGYAALVLTGADGKSYITVVDTKGNQQYALIRIEDWKRTTWYDSQYNSACWQGYVYVTIDGKETILDPKGKVSSLQEIWELSSSFTIGDHVVRDGYEHKYDKSKKRYVGFKRLDGTVLDTVYVISNYDMIANQEYFVPTQTEAPLMETAKPSKQYITPSSFTIEGKWKNTGTYTFGQVQQGAIVAFDGKNCNFFSPMDTYAFYKSGSNFKLDCTSYLFSDTLSFTVKIIDNDHIDIYNRSNCLELTRVS